MARGDVVGPQLGLRVDGCAHAAHDSATRGAVRFAGSHRRVPANREVTVGVVEVSVAEHVWRSRGERIFAHTRRRQGRWRRCRWGRSRRWRLGGVSRRWRRRVGIANATIVIVVIVIAVAILVVIVIVIVDAILVTIAVVAVIAIVGTIVIVIAHSLPLAH